MQSSDEKKFLYRTLKTTIWVTIVVAILAAYYYGLLFGLGLIVSSFWNIGNFWIIVRLATALLLTESKERKKIVYWAALKFPVWYGIGYLILRFANLPVIGLIVGFSILFCILILKVVGIQIIGQTNLIRNPK